MIRGRDFTWSTFRIAWADNNEPNVVFLAGPQVAASSLPSGWVETVGYGCGPDRSRNGGEASASVILLKAVGGEVLSRPSGWTYGIECAQRTAVRIRILFVRLDIRSTKDCAHLHVEKSDEPSPRIPFSHRGRLAAYADAKVTDSFRIQREKDEIRQERPVRYLTRLARLAKQIGKLATLAPKMATLMGDFVNLGGSRWQPC